MAMMVCIQIDSDLAVTEAINHGANGMSGIITVRTGDISFQFDEKTAEQFQTAIANSREKLRVAKAKHIERRVAA